MSIVNVVKYDFTDFSQFAFSWIYKAIFGVWLEIIFLAFQACNRPLISLYYIF